MGVYLYKVRPARADMLKTGPTDSEAAVVSEHFAYLKSLTDKGIVLLAGRTLEDDESSFGIVIYRAETPEEARRLLEDDPAIHRGVFLAEMHRYRIALVNAAILDRTNQE